MGGALNQSSIRGFARPADHLCGSSAGRLRKGKIVIVRNRDHFLDDPVRSVLPENGMIRNGSETGTQSGYGLIPVSSER